ncbi:hypothetical protein F5890DRAFT_1553642 [Lentinula detonsa]|uniref:Uncharacterized protein n=1 Tax=Lentinula detonsa TaxID=2804962 RepID=A0AA38Q148_9AGAR|nr:hypothetical protein F5890DRAFT_1553642 [Lentinula detonsa]
MLQRDLLRKSFILPLRRSYHDESFGFRTPPSFVFPDYNDAQLENRHHNAALLRYVDSVRTHGHRAARIDPLDLIPRDSEVAALNPSRYGLKEGNKRYNSSRTCPKVWKVKDSNAKIRVLKDVWLESDRLEEHKIREAILADAMALNEEDAQLEKRMLRPMAYWRVPVGEAQMVNLITPKNPPVVHTQSVAMSMPSDRDSVSRFRTAVVDQNSDGIHQNKRPRPQRIITGSCLSNAPQLSMMNEVYPTFTDIHVAGLEWVHTTNVVVAAVDLHGSSHPRNTALSS